MSRTREGTCALTGKSGRFVKAHLIPAALTRHSEPGSHFIEAGENSRPRKRWTSWYDHNLVTAEGERVLAEYDDWGIKALRDLKLIWSGWEGGELKASDEVAADNLGRGLRIIEGADGDRLRLFFLSILWRAAASQLPEFACVDLRRAQLNIIARMILTKNPNPPFFFPVALVQLKTKGDRHNASPTTHKKPLGSKRSPRSARIFRFYFDGLIMHFHRDVNPAVWRSMGGMAIGSQDKLGVITMPYEVSAQGELVDRVAAEAETEWPDVIARLSKR